MGWSELPRHHFFCQGPKAFRSFHHPNGTGSTRLNQFIFERGTDAKLRLLDFGKTTNDHAKISKPSSEPWDSQRTRNSCRSLSMGFDGRLTPQGRNEWATVYSHSNKARAKGLGVKPLQPSSRRGGTRYTAFRVCSETEPLTLASLCPLPTSPAYAIGMGGQDKADKQEEKRPTGNTHLRPPQAYIRAQPPSRLARWRRAGVMLQRHHTP